MRKIKTQESLKVRRYHIFQLIKAVKRIETSIMRKIKTQESLTIRIYHIFQLNPTKKTSII